MLYLNWAIPAFSKWFCAIRFFLDFTVSFHWSNTSDSTNDTPLATSRVCATFPWMLACAARADADNNLQRFVWVV